jgi:hypothetical protein
MNQQQLPNASSYCLYIWNVVESQHSSGYKYDMQSTRTRFALGTYIACFGIGVVSHAADFLSRGWRPYAFGPPALEAFWTSLIVLDALVIVLIIAGWRRCALLLAAVVMVTDVSANAFASFALQIPGFNLALILQAAFLGFVLGSLPFLWPSKLPPAIGGQGNNP